MNKLNYFLNNYLPDNVKLKNNVIKDCCDNKELFISPNIIKYVCINCGVVSDDDYNIDDVEKFKGNYVKTFIGYSPNSRLRSKIYRLQKWNNYDRLEIKMNEYLKFISKLPIDDEVIIKNTQIKYKELLPMMNIRGNNRKALICYCLYFSYKKYKKDVDIDELFIMLNIKFKNYNDIMKNITSDKIYYIENINNYLELIDNKINKNYLIDIYNLFYDISSEFNKKTLIIGLIYFILDNDKYLFRQDYINKFKISENSLYIILFHINHNKNIIYKYIKNESE